MKSPVLTPLLERFCMLRAFWYAMEVSSQSNTDINAGVCHVVWDKGSSPFDFDRYAWQGYCRHLTHSWPMKPTAIHSCCTPAFVVRIIKPSKYAMSMSHVLVSVLFSLTFRLRAVLFYFLNKEGRAGKKWITVHCSGNENSAVSLCSDVHSVFVITQGDFPWSRV